MESTTTNGITNEIKKPTRRAGIICESAIKRKNRLKKYLNWLKSTFGMKEYQVYLQLLMALPGYLFFLFYSVSR